MDEIVTSFELSLEPDTELAGVDAQPFSVELIRESKIATTISRARYGSFQEKRACLLTFESKFIPYYGVRFKYVEVELRIVRSDASIIAYKPHQWRGKASTTLVQQTSRVGAPGVSAGGVNIGADVGYTRQSEHGEVKRAWLESELESTAVSWRLGENDATREGVPKPFQGALIITAEEELSIRVKYYVKLSKSADPMSWRPGYARTAKPLKLDRTFIGEGVGPDVDGVDAMEKEEFQLSSFISTSWDM
ncbi:MAG: hypothetical protein M1813_002316 [Trichoglossum hirsutum]|nr:MAG: hypothetical protein M1813_002316 [Trichoglossum hirsutum]